jgi:hypothetical protein
VRLVFLVAAASVALVGGAACGLDSNGLAVDDGGESLAEAGPAFDGTIELGDATGVIPPPEPDSGSPTADDSGSSWLVDSGGDSAPAYTDAGPDAACTGDWTCTAGAIPAGWRVVEYVETSRPACTTGYDSPLDVYEGPSGAAATCSCSCDVTTPGSCQSGNFSTSGSVGSATSCSSPPVSASANGGACTAIAPSPPPPAGAKLQIAPAQYAPGACTPSAMTNVPGIQYAGQGVLCADSVVSSAVCSNAGVCVPTAAASGFHLCIITSGTQTCPAGLGFTHSHAISTGVTDTRGCSTCTCDAGTASCTNAQLSLFTSPSCSGNGTEIPANSSCTSVPNPSGPPPSDAGDGGFGYVAFEYTAQVHGEGCPSAGGAPTGSVSLTSTHTVCCQ